MGTVDRAGIRERIAKLAAESSQSELARRTGVSVVSVNRYLKGTRVPADFCAELVRSMNVNPAWLLMGEGTPYLSDITGGTGAMAGNVLELVEAMNSVARMRLGALTGKHHLRVLRELNDALVSYEGLRKKLDTHSVPIFKQLLLDLANSLNQFKLQHAADLRKAAEQVARLCDDRQLQRRLIELQAHDEYLAGREQEALKYHRALMLEPLVHGSILTLENCRTIYRMILILDTLGRLPEALRTCEAVIALSDEESDAWEDMASLRFLRGRLLAKLGNLHEGLAQMVRWLPRTPKYIERAFKLWIMPHMLNAGTLSPDEAFEYGDHIPPKAIAILRHASWLEEPGFLRRALDYLTDKRMQQLGEMRQADNYERLLLRAIEQRDKSVLRECADTVAGMYIEYRHPQAVYRTQLLRLLNMRPQARRELLKADAEFGRLPRATPPEPTTAAIHHRNVVLLTKAGDKGELAQLRKRSIAWFEQQVSNGFIVYAPMLETRDGTHSHEPKAGKNA